MTTLASLKSQIDQYRYNPTRIQGAILRLLRDVSGGKIDIVDPSNPFVFLLEAAATIGASNMTENAANNRKQYAKVAQNFNDLYRHMHYGEFQDIFALPSSVPFVLGFNKEELISRMVQVPGTDIRKIVIPRNTTITISDTVFSLQYPIELRQMSHSGLQVVFDVEKTSPLKSLSTNVIDWKPHRGADGQEMVMFPLYLDQFNIITLSDVVSAMQKFTLTTTITDKFYYCRVWKEVTPNVWEELPTTYSQDIYSNNKPTAIVKVVNKEVSVEIPIIYVKTGQISGKVRMDVYQTKGPLSMDLSSFDDKQFVVNWLAIDKSEQNEFVAPLKAVASTVVHSQARTSGGRDPMGFEELKERVIQNAFSPVLPITPAQAQKKLERNGYNIVKNIDHVTDRVFAATRPMPAPRDVELITSASAGIHTLSETIERLGVLSTSYTNSDSLTLSPKTLYRIERGVLKVCSDAEVSILNSMPGDKKALAITEGSYFYSPFHYVFDTDNNTFASRAYYLDSPKIESRSFIAENDTTLFQVSTQSALVRRIALGWEVIITTRSSQEWKDLDDDEVFVNIGFQPDRSGNYAYVPGVYLGKTEEGERVYRFDIKTSYDIDANNGVELVNAMMYEESQQYLRTNLRQDFDLFYSTSRTMPASWTPASFDPMIGSFLLPFGSVGISRERLDITLGYALTNLWTRGRTVAGENDYARWEMDVPATYENDVYEVDPVTGISFTVVNGELVYNKLHDAGDPVIHDGDPVFKYRKGDIKKDAYGAPIVTGGRKLTRQIDLFLLEAPYYFATNKAAVDYRQELVETVVKWISEDLRDINKMLLEKSTLYFYPVQNVGTVDVVTGAGLKTTISAGQYFNLKLYVRDSVYKNEKLREAINRATVVTINECLKAKTVSTTQIINALKDTYGDDVLSFDVEGLGGEANLAICTMVDDSARLTLRKKLEYRVDQTFALRDDVNVEFVAHERAGVELET